MTFHKFIILFFVSLGCINQANATKVVPFGDWSYVEGKKLKKIYTRNQHKYEFSFECKKECIFYITPATVCREKQFTDGWLIQPSGIAKSIRTTCIKNDGKSVLKILNEPGLLEIFSTVSEAHFLINFDLDVNSLLTFRMLGFFDAFNRLNKN
jgi:hypothetical protein